MHFTARFLSFAGLLAVIVGCSANFPYGMSLNRHNFTSTHHMPMRLELMDTITGETVWSLDVPVGEEAIVEFENPDTWQASQRGAAPAEEVRWDIVDPDAKLADLQHSQELSGRPVVLKVRRRELSAEIDGPEAVGSDNGGRSVGANGASRMSEPSRSAPAGGEQQAEPEASGSDGQASMEEQ